MMYTTLKMYFLEIHLQEETVSEMYRDCQISSEVIFPIKGNPQKSSSSKQKYAISINHFTAYRACFSNKLGTGMTAPPDQNETTLHPPPFFSLKPP